MWEQGGRGAKAVRPGGRGSKLGKRRRSAWGKRGGVGSGGGAVTSEGGGRWKASSGEAGKEEPGKCFAKCVQRQWGGL